MSKWRRSGPQHAQHVQHAPPSPPPPPPPPHPPQKTRLCREQHARARDVKWRRSGVALRSSACLLPPIPAAPGGPAKAFSSSCRQAGAGASMVGGPLPCSHLSRAQQSRTLQHAGITRGAGGSSTLHHHSARAFNMETTGSDGRQRWQARPPQASPHQQPSQIKARRQTAAATGAPRRCPSSR